MILITTTTQATMTMRHLNEQSGYIDVAIKQQEIVKESDIIIHVINLEDRQTIQNKLFNINDIRENNNQQIIINDFFNLTLNHLKTVINYDRILIETELNSINKYLNEENEKTAFLEQLTNIQLIKNKLEQIQDNIISAKYGLVHPSILTSDEITKYEIDYHKIKYIQTGTAYFNHTYLLFGLNIPKEFIEIELRTIVPLTNNKSYEIDYNIEQIFDYDNKTYAFEENKYLKDLKLSKHCIVKNNCKMTTNKDLEIVQLELDTIVIKNSKNLYINNSCNSNDTILNGNFLITFNNCSIRIKDYYFSNFNEYERKIPIKEYRTINNFSHQI